MSAGGSGIIVGTGVTVAVGVGLPNATCNGIPGRVSHHPNPTSATNPNPTHNSRPRGLRATTSIPGSAVVPVGPTRVPGRRTDSGFSPANTPAISSTL